MSNILAEPPVEPVRNYFSQMCVLLTGIASGTVDPDAGESVRSPSYHMGRRDGYHVVVAHLATSASLREAADKCEAFGRGVDDRAADHPYGPDWSSGFAHATIEAAGDIAMYAATESLPFVDKVRLRSARIAARQLSPLSGLWAQRPASLDTPRSPREW